MQWSWSALSGKAKILRRPKDAWGVDQIYQVKQKIQRCNGVEQLYEVHGETRWKNAFDPVNLTKMCFGVQSWHVLFQRLSNESPGISMNAVRFLFYCLSASVVSRDNQWSWSVWHALSLQMKFVCVHCGCANEVSPIKNIIQPMLDLKANTVG